MPRAEQRELLKEAGVTPDEFADPDDLGIECEIAEKGKTLTRKLYASQSATGVAAFQLPGWRFPAVVQEDGSCKDRKSVV